MRTPWLAAGVLTLALVWLGPLPEMAPRHFSAHMVMHMGIVAIAAPLLAGPWLSGLDPTSHVYPAIVWILVAWTVLHILVGVIMQAYCLARRLAGRMTARYDTDMANVALYWHFCALTIGITVAVIAGFPLVA